MSSNNPNIWSMEPLRSVCNSNHSSPKPATAISPQAYTLKLESHYSLQFDTSQANWLHPDHATTSHGLTYRDDSHSVSSCSMSGTPDISNDYTVNNYEDLVYNNRTVTALDPTLFATDTQHQAACQDRMMIPLLQHETQPSAQKFLSHSYHHDPSVLSSYQAHAVGSESGPLYAHYNWHHNTSSPILSHTAYMEQMDSLPTNTTACNQFEYSNQSMRSNNINSYSSNAQSTFYPGSSSISSNITFNNNYSTYYGKKQHYNIFGQNSASKQQQQQQKQQQQQQLCIVNYEQQQQQQQQQHNHFKYLRHHKYQNQMITTTEAVSATHNNTINASNNNEAHTMIRQKNSQGRSTQNRYPCLYPGCTKVFTRPYNLKSHMRTHTKEKPYECATCHYKFARPHDLKRHELQHTGEKPHKCRFCPRRFARSDAVKRHWQKDANCKQALKEETRLNGGKEVKTRRKKSTK